jgi:hypothetical protein
MMALTVNDAFGEFMANIVNLDPTESDLAKSSRAWLMDRIHELPAKDDSFPGLYVERDIHFGSFERKTKKRPLDDIDIMVCIGAETATWSEGGNVIYMETSNSSSPLYGLRHDNSLRINSRKVINKFVDALGGITQYGKAEIGRRSEAVILNLRSYDWTFDIVPCFFSAPDSFDKQFYIIPDGDGNWKRTDPRIDRARIQGLVTQKGSNLLNVIRLVKYWNKRPTMPSMGSYLLENMILSHYENHECTSWPDLNFSQVIDQLRNRILGTVLDPKGFQGDLNDVDLFDRLAIYNRCNSDFQKCLEASQLETKGEMRAAINKWAEVFGPLFPSYG